MGRMAHRVLVYECNQLLAQADQKFHAKWPPATMSPLAELKRAMKLLSESWSAMAGRNLMNDVLRALLRIEPALPPDLKTGCNALKKKIEKVLKSHAVTSSRYDSALCLGYRVKTTGPIYSGKADDWQDMKQRCEDMKAAIRSAYIAANAYGNYNQKPNILKIFMAPEFYFRGRHGAYDLDDVTGVAQGKQGILEILRQEIDKDIYRDWLFVLGTAIAASKVTTTVCAVCNGEVQFTVDRGTGKSVPTCKTDRTHQGVSEETEGAMIDNIAFVVKEKEVHTVTKELVSHIDFIRNEKKGKKDVVKLRDEWLKVIRHKQPSGYNAASGRPTKFQDERMGGSVFTIDGVTFGLEVCLDHAATRQAPDAGRLAGGANIQVQLVPSAGMGISALRTVPNGIVFNVDGATPHVQVVGGGPSPEVCVNLIGSGNVQWQLLLDANVDRDPGKIPGYFDNLGPEWNIGPWQPKVAAGGSGAVILYGPYEIPNA